MPELNRDRVVAPGASPERWLYVLHGIYGAGRNWASVIRRVVRERPEWGALLIDLRQHGGSQGFPEPHTVAASADDLALLAEQGEPAPAAVLGHSFGGKVAMVYSIEHPAGLQQLWVIDSTPESREPTGSAWNMLEILRRMPERFESRDELIGALEEEGVQPGIAQWMATNLEADGGGYRWRFDLDAIEALLRDFFRTDAWAAVEAPAEGVEVHLVRARESSVLAGDALARAQTAARGSDRVHLHEVDGGHWVNADNPDALVRLLTERLPG